MKSKMIILALVLAWGSNAQAQDTYILLAEDFEGLELGPNVDEGLAGDAVWTETPPAGWVIDESGVPGIGDPSTDGVTEWAGWAFTNKDWWTQAAGDQRRSEYDLGQGTVLVADPDEWDDAGHADSAAAGWYKTFISTNAIDISAARPGTVQLRFDSSWRPEFDSDYHQTGNLTVSFDGGDPIELLLWESDSSSPNFKDDNSTNETIFVDIDNPEQAATMVLTFGLFEAGNDWWWAIDNILLTAAYTADKASNPSPRTLTDELPAKTVLTWTPGAYVSGLSPQHRVILSDNLDAVKDGSAVVAEVDVNSFDATGLIEYDTTYFWRIDEANRTSGWDEGSIWQFATEPFAIPVETITATATSETANMGPENTVNGSGLNELDQHSTTATDMWLSGMGDATPAIQFEFDKTYKLHEMLVWNSNQLIEAFVGLGAKDVVVEYSLDGAEWTVLEGITQFTQATGTETYTSNTIVEFGGAVAKYVRITISSGYGVLPQFGLSEVRFMAIPTNAREPQPTDGSVTDGTSATLSWRSGREAVSSEVYLGTDPADLALLGTTTGNSIVASGLNLSTTYYWSVTEVNEAADPAAYAGGVWSFTTSAYATVDDFDQYDDFCQRIFFAWEDGIGHNGGEEVPDCDEPPSNGNGGGSIVGNDTAPFAERTLVNADSRQSMPLSYDNAFGQSEATLTLGSQDWTIGGIKTLSLFFYGQPENSGQLYVKINNTKVVFDGDADALAQEQWQQWAIDLTAIAGLQNVTSLTLGVDGGSAKGLLYIDDIRLEP